MNIRHRHLTLMHREAPAKACMPIEQDDAYMLLTDERQSARHIVSGRFTLLIETRSPPRPVGWLMEIQLPDALMASGELLAVAGGIDVLPLLTVDTGWIVGRTALSCEDAAWMQGEPLSLSLGVTRRPEIAVGHMGCRIWARWILGVHMIAHAYLMCLPEAN